MIVPKIYYYGETKLWMAGGYMDEWRALGVHYGMNQEDGPDFNVAKHCTYSPTCFMLVKKEVFEKWASWMNATLPITTIPILYYGPPVWATGFL